MDSTILPINTGWRSRIAWGACCILSPVIMTAMFVFATGGSERYTEGDPFLYQEWRFGFERVYFLPIQVILPILIFGPTCYSWLYHSTPQAEPSLPNSETAQVGQSSVLAQDRSNHPGASVPAVSEMAQPWVFAENWQPSVSADNKSKQQAASTLLESEVAQPFTPANGKPRQPAVVNPPVLRTAHPLMPVENRSRQQGRLAPAVTEVAYNRPPWLPAQAKPKQPVTSIPLSLRAAQPSMPVEGRLGQQAKSSLPVPKTACGWQPAKAGPIRQSGLPMPKPLPDRQSWVFGEGRPNQQEQRAPLLKTVPTRARSSNDDDTGEFSSSERRGLTALLDWAASDPCPAVNTQRSLAIASSRRQPGPSRHGQAETSGNSSQQPFKAVEDWLPQAPKQLSYPSPIQLSTTSKTPEQLPSPPASPEQPQAPIRQTGKLQTPPGSPKLLQTPTQSPRHLANPPVCPEPLRTPTPSSRELASPPVSPQPLRTPTPSPRQLFIPPERQAQPQTPTTSPRQLPIVSESPEQLHISTQSLRQLPSPLRSPEQGPSGPSIILNTGYDDPSSQAQSTACRKVPLQRKSVGSASAFSSPPQPNIGGPISPTPSILSTEDPARLVPSFSSPSFLRSPPQDESFSPAVQVVSRRECKERLFEEARGWDLAPSDDELKRLIRLDEDSGVPLPDIYAIKREQRRYEKYARRRTEMEPKPFSVFGTPATYPVDRLRCWVLTENHMDPRTPFPPEYEPVSQESKDHDYLSTVSSLGL